MFSAAYDVPGNIHFFLFYSFSFLTGDSKALTNLVVYNEISVKFYFLSALR